MEEVPKVYAEFKIVQKVMFDGRSFMMCSGICLHGCTNLYILRSLTAVRYKDEFFEPIFRPIGDNIIFIQDNVRSHRE